MSETLLAGVSRLRESGLSIIPIKTDGSKRPALQTWKPFEDRLPTETELRQWFGNGKKYGLALIGGKVSGNLEILDFDAPEIIAEWRALVEEAAPGLLARLPQVETPAGGLHVFYRCETIQGNQKLAEREVEVSEGTKGARQREGRWFRVETLIETRGEGGYVITAGSPAACHPSGKLYRLIHGDLRSIPAITEHERNVLLTCARSLNEFIKPANQVAPERAPKPAPGLRPGEDFNQRGDVRALLEKHGWRRLGKGRLGEKWRRPGGDHQSATLFDSGNLYVFSSNGYPLELGSSYSPFALLASLEHEGDFQAAAKALAAQGYGQKGREVAAKPKKPAQTRVGEITFTNVESGEQTGVWATDADGNRTRVCSPLSIEADTCDEHGENWGRLLVFADRSGVTKRWAMPMSLLAGDGQQFREQLLSLGLTVEPGAKARNLLTAYLNTKPEKTALCVTRQGWHRGVFVLPDQSIGTNSEPVYLQTILANHPFRQAGTVEDWREQVGRHCARNSRLLLAVSVAFAAPLLEPLGGESGGVHFTGGSSKGKTTTLFVAGSVHGGGGDKGFILCWRATTNGLETVAESHHDSLLCLDEISECRPDDVNEAAYMLANGQGKTRQSRNGALRRTLEWRVLFLSSGEISIADHVAQSGKSVRAGQDVRVINLPADAGKELGLFEDLHGFASADEFARHLQQAARQYYGAPIRAFLSQAVRQLDSLRQRYRVFESALLAEILPAEAAGEVRRVAHRFALVAFAGELATEFGITGWEAGDATAAAKTLFSVWLESRGTTGSRDEEIAIQRVRSFIEQHGASRFQRLRSRFSASGEDQTHGEERTIFDRVGYVRPDDDGEVRVFYLLGNSFRQACGGFNYVEVAKSLSKRGLLEEGNDKKHLHQKQLRTPEGSPWVYAIKSEILSET